MATDILAHLSAADLRRAAEVREEIASLEAEIQSILSGSGSSSPAPRKKKSAGKKPGPKPKKKATKKKKRGKPGPKPVTKRPAGAAKPGPKPKNRGKPGPKPGAKRPAGAAKPGPKPKKKAAKKKAGAKRKFSPEAIARIRAAQKKRWAKAKKK